MSGPVLPRHSAFMPLVILAADDMRIWKRLAASAFAQAARSRPVLSSHGFIFLEEVELMTDDMDDAEDIDDDDISDDDIIEDDDELLL
jgi:hypothetical protein